MDRIAKGMSQAGRNPCVACTKQESLVSRMTRSFKGVTERVGHMLKGKEPVRRASSR